MLPVDPSIDDHMKNNINYYFFEPAPRRLMSVWKRSTNLSNLANGGHKLEDGDISFFPNRMLVKLFIVRSQKHSYRSASCNLRKICSFTKSSLFIPAPCCQGAPAPSFAWTKSPRASQQYQLFDYCESNHSSK